jgi:uncharacterized BrkB/YihY/UPF0761 family membrane protein
MVDIIRKAIYWMVAAALAIAIGAVTYSLCVTAPASINLPPQHTSYWWIGTFLILEILSVGYIIVWPLYKWAWRVDEGDNDFFYTSPP